MKTEVDAGQHLLLINRVINQMGLRGDVAEEAYSEGLVIITEAAQRYDPDRGVPVANWLGNNIRWSLLSWLRKERRPSFHNDENEKVIIQTPTKTDQGYQKVFIEELIQAMKDRLTEKEYQVMMLTAMEFNGKEVCAKLGMTAVQVTRAKKNARKKIEDFK